MHGLIFVNCHRFFCESNYLIIFYLTRNNNFLSIKIKNELFREKKTQKCCSFYYRDYFFVVSNRCQYFKLIAHKEE